MQQRITVSDDWNTLEQACLASAVRLFGDRETNWSTVCNHLKTRFSLIERPGNWLTPESCEAQYKWLSDKYVKMEISCERPVNQILQNLKQIGECESLPVLEQERKYKDLKEKLELFANNEIDSDIMMEFYEKACKRNREREENSRKLGLKTESSNIIKSVKSDNKTDVSSPLTTSPLLSSLLNNPPAVQYRPTLSTASFIPTKASQGTSRTSYERVHTSEGNVRSVCSSTLGSQSSSSSERTTLYSTSVSLTARKLDFQEPSTSTPIIPQELHLPTIKESNKDTGPNNESVAKSSIHNLENIHLIPATEEYLSDADMLLQVIDNLEGKQLLDKVLDELTGEKESIIEKNLNAGSISTDNSFVTNSPSSKNTTPIINLLPESKPAVIVDSSLLSTKFDNLNNEYSAAEDVIIIEDEASNKQVLESVSSTSVVHSSIAETVTVNRSISSSSFTSESISEVKSDLEPASEYLNTSTVGKFDKSWSIVESIQTEKKMDSKSVNKFSDTHVNDGTSTTSEGCEHRFNTPEIGEIHETFISDESCPSKGIIVEVSSTEEEVTPSTPSNNESEIEREKEQNESGTEETVVLDASLTIKLKDTFELEDIPVNENVQITEMKEANISKAEIDQNTNANDDIKSECIDSTEGSLLESSTKSTVSEAISEAKQVTVANVPSSVLPTIAEETVSTPVEEKVDNGMLSSSVEIIANDEVLKTPPSTSIHRRQLPRRKRSTASESSESLKITKTTADETENSEKEDPIVKKGAGSKEINITIKDFQSEGFDPEIVEGLCKLKEEPAEDIITQPTQTPVKARTGSEKSPVKISDSKKTKQRTVTNRRSSVRSQNQNTSTPKAEDVPASPSTNSSSKMNDSALAKKRSLVLAHQRLCAQKYSSAFLKPISNRTVPGYEDVIFNPLDLQTIKRKIDNRVIATVTDFQRDVLLMILNAKMFNRINSQVYNMAVELQKEALGDIQLTVQTLGEGVLFEMEDEISEKVRKRQSVDNMKKDQKPSKRSKLSLKDEMIPAKKIKLEENESIS